MLNIEAYRTIQAVVDTQPTDDVMDFDNPTMNAAGDDFEEKLREAAARVPKDFLQRMIEASCIDSYLVPDDYADLPDDHGNSEGDATAIRVGADVRGELEYDDDIDFFRFQAEPGWSYQIDVALGTLDDSIVELHDANGSFLDTNDNYGNSYASRLSWRATSSGERYVLVGGYGIGTYTLTVSLIDDHGNDFESATRIAIGEAVAVELENFDDMDVLVFRARPGTEFLLTLDWEYYAFRENYTEPPLLAVYSANGQEQTRLMSYDLYETGVPSIDLVWRALTGGDYYIVIGDGKYRRRLRILRNRGGGNGTNSHSHRGSQVHVNPATHAARGFLRLRQRREGPHLRGEEQWLRRLLGLGWIRPGHAVRRFLRLHQRRGAPHLRGEEQRLRRLLGRQCGWQGHAARGFLHLRQYRGEPHLWGEEQRFRRLLGRQCGWQGHAARGFLRLHQRRAGPHLRGEERRLRRLLGLG